MTVRVRGLGTEDDTAEAARLLTAFFAEEGFATPPATIERHVGQMAKLDVCGLFQAEADGEVIGVATVSLEFGIEYGWSADLYVVPHWRGRGIAGQMMKVLEAFLIRKGASGYQVTVTRDAEKRRAISGYYHKLVFRYEGRRLLFKSLP